MNRTHLRRGVAAVVAATLVLAACGDDDTDTADPGPTATESTGHDHGDMAAREVGDQADVPTVSLDVTPDGDGAVALVITTTGFTFGPEVDDEGAEHVEGEGHVHVYVDGVKVTRIYTDEYRVEDLAPGEHEISVSMNGNDHRPWAVDGEPIEAAQTVAVDGESTTSPSTVIDVAVENGNVENGGRTGIELGSTVTIRVASDVSDHVHLHGYDVMVDVTAGEPAELTFEATIPGVFEVELEDSGLPLLELEIS